MKLAIKFTDGSPSFTHGVEFGRILQKMELGNQNVDNEGFPVRIENKQVYISACKYYNYTPVFGDVWFNEWVSFIAIKNTSFELPVLN
ncbi:hypothetical protein [Aquimarina macrocephali]|uniref:hypothetical protein n=1 Tax=Aquimarina macrocephali TaxID=666563 RepID=UPI003F666805